MSASVILHPGREKSLLRRHPWIFNSAIKEHKGVVRNGDTVDIFSGEGEFLAKGAWSTESQIQLRVWTFDRQEVVDNGFFLRKLDQAIALRESIVLKHGLTGYRIVAAESDGLPGITIDKYANVIVCQLLSAGAEKHRKKIVWALNKRFPDCSILERSDVAVRAKEGLPELVQTLHGDVPDEVIIEENGVKIIVDLIQGHKTGFYLDQRDNRAIAGSYADNKSVLNCFSYTGTFACYALKGGANSVVNMDVSENALATAKRNLEINKLDISKASFVKKDVFEALREYRDNGTTFDMIVLDPPKFVDSKASLNRACRGYKDINMLAMKILNPGGILLTFSCSGLLSSDLFQKVVADAALDANKTIHFLERLGQAPDHPVASNYPEGFYLKGLVCRVS
ncbi:class I SAM-dependent methyltransferase [Aliiglaciecola sp. 2_MG-2023]|uniref:class I SAM-dependent methyltransferase n=1 Tax=unclassified Aliiglaciecola TaxID=2593648 RepID=UPI0026E20E99|nr:MULTISPECIES: class I SAM-dependent methyltransferase [unclassified Aliiglaciecola]MDO6712249.1 class I SAM-dependent methyltransferase [Aliiglaciecola sp. 2_MG-2023]MDO6753513.1 class I SAM-dependent methyltransferase [Aliiglaciecola sp. 1_MG-2023]